MDTPILFLIFNRPHIARQSFAAIKKAKPKQLFIAADGPRKDRPNEKKLCNEARNIIEEIDWECEVKTLFREENLGCGIAPYQAITWFFEQVEKGIILEDDCLPDASFFTFCEELLERYKEEERIMHIAGSNFQMGRKHSAYSYFFSFYPPGWGWATWRRAWKHYDFYLKNANADVMAKILAGLRFLPKEQAYWLRHFEEVKGGRRADIWDLQWTFSIWLQGGIAVSPQVNLISNVGFGDDATHTFQKDSRVANLPTTFISQIQHPPQISIDYQADRFTYRNHIEPPISWYTYLRYSLLPRLTPTFIKKLSKQLR